MPAAAETMSGAFWRGISIAKGPAFADPSAVKHSAQCIWRLTVWAVSSTTSVMDCMALPAVLLGLALGRRSMSAARPVTAPHHHAAEKPVFHCDLLLLPQTYRVPKVVWPEAEILLPYTPAPAVGIFACGVKGSADPAPYRRRNPRDYHYIFRSHKTHTPDTYGPRCAGRAGCPAAYRHIRSPGRPR